MKGVVFKGYKKVNDSGNESYVSFPYNDFPSIAFGAGTIQKEDMYRYSKRDATGLMRRIGYIGQTIKIECKWALLRKSEFDLLVDLTSQKEFDVDLYWNGESRTVRFYAGNISSTPYRLDSGGDPMYYTNVSFSIISLETLVL